MIENWKKTDDREKKGEIFMELQAFDTINRSLLLAELKAYGFLTKLKVYYKVIYAADFRES